MRAMRIAGSGGPEVLQPVMLPIPKPRAGEVLVRVAAAGVNRPDVLQRRGLYAVPADADPLPGLEIAGEVIENGSGVTRFQAGDQVMALTHGGGYAEYCRVHESHCLAVPEGLSLTMAAAIPETFFTVHYNLFMRAGLASGETLLLHGGSSGIGTTAIQLAREKGVSIITTAGNDEKCRFCESLGADHAINYRETDWQQSLLQLTDNRGVDVVLDMVAGPYMQKNIDVLRKDGRYVIIGFLQGPRAELDLRRVLSNRLTITGSTLRPQTIEEKAAIARSIETEIVPLFEAGAVKPIIHATFPLEEAAKAHTLMESSQHIGKIVLQVT